MQYDKLSVNVQVQRRNQNKANRGKLRHLP